MVFAIRLKCLCDVICIQKRLKLFKTYFAGLWLKMNYGDLPKSNKK